MQPLFKVPLKQDIMFLRGDGTVYDGRFCLPQGKELTTDTYFGCFPFEDYTAYTTIDLISATVRIKGKGRIELRHLSVTDDTPADSCFFNSDFIEKISFSVKISDYLAGCFYLKISADEDSEIYEISYEGEGESKDTKISVIVCTYHREEQVLKNLELISETIAENPLLKECLSIICVDNGGSLKNAPSDVKTVKNPNYGGSGGYARGMLEAAGCTHFWMMDDDIEIDPSILLRAVSFILYRKKDDLRLAAGMFPFEDPTVQHEATASSNGYTFVSNGHDLDFRNREALLKNRIEYRDNLYGGWWSFIMPAEERFPMPFFIKLDDVEYSLRNPGTFAILNGFGVWHEAFGKKANAWSEYYTTRNTLIMQSMHNNLPHNAVKMMGIRLLKALAYGESKCMEAALGGVKDYAAGPEVFKETNPEERHKEILKIFNAPLTQDMTRKKMLQRAVKNMFKPGNWKSFGYFLDAISRLKKAETAEWVGLSTREFWLEYLGLSKER